MPVNPITQGNPAMQDSPVAAPIAAAEATPCFHEEQAAREYLERLLWKDGAFCPRCESKNVSERPAKQAWRCNDCRFDFTLRSGTVFEHSHIPLHKWLYAAYLIASSGSHITSARLGRELGLRQATAWKMMRRLSDAGGTVVRDLLAGLFTAGGDASRPDSPKRPPPARTAGERPRDGATPRRELAAKILDGITGGTFAGSGRLPPERELAARFGAGRGAIREALIVLDTLGYVEVRGKEGVFVRGLSEEDCNRSLDFYSAWPTEMLPHTFHVRLLLESEAAGLAALNRAESDLERMAGCIEELDRIRRRPPSDWRMRGSRLNDLFHRQVLEAAHNPVLLRIHEGVLAVIRRAYNTFGSESMVTPLERWEHVIVHGHQAILDAVAAGDDRTAREAMRKHLEITFQKLDALYRERIQGVLRHLRS